MDPDPYAPNLQDTYTEWNEISPSTILEDTYPEIKPPSTRSTSPPKRPRNAKNLSLNVPTAPDNSFPTPAPLSPFRSPRLPIRRPSNLTINVHSLHRHPSTPELYNSHLGTPIVSSPAPLPSQRQFPGLNVDVPRHHDPDRPKTRHTDPAFHDYPYDESVEREKAYPDGPRLILEPNIWLYAEPDLHLAKTYDLVVNVAREVTNPFIVTETTLATTEPSRLSPESDFEETTPSPFSPFSSSVSVSSPSAPSSLSSGVSISPKLPNKTPTSPTTYKYNDVEYMHVPWDHNSSLTRTPRNRRPHPRTLCSREKSPCPLPGKYLHSFSEFDTNSFSAASLDQRH